MVLPNNTLLQGGRYKIVRFISSGGFGCTYEAEHVMLHKKVAIKEFFVKDFCNRDETTSEVSVGITSKTALVEKLKKKFIEEARSLCLFEHPNIVHVFDVFEENGTAYYVMDYIDGPSLNELVKKNGAMSEAQAVAYIKQVADALGFVHSHNRLHLDIKPGNIMIDVNGKAILIDFGASKQYDEEAGENTSTLIGKTPGYAPLEQMGNDVVKFMPSTDIYALGATLYKILTGVTPPSAMLLASGETLEDMPSVSASTRNAIMEAMKTNKMKRPQSVEEFVKLLLPESTHNPESASDNNDENTLFEQEPIRQPKQQTEEEIRRKIEEEYRKKEELRLYEEERKRKKEEREKEEQKKKEEEEKALKATKHTRINKTWISIVIGIVAVFGVIIGISRKSSNAVDENTENANPENSNQEISKTFNVNGVSFEMMIVQAGTFTMGPMPGMEDSWTEKLEIPTHQVTLTNNYYIGKTEVTQALWNAVMGSNPSGFVGDELPVNYVSWNDCQQFISKLNSMTNQNFRLPTEAEWEFAARGGNSSNHYLYSGSNQLDDVAWNADNSGDELHAVATKQPNELGIYDMSGNVAEWCSDWMGEYSSNPETNPTGPDSGEARVHRGGTFFHGYNQCYYSCRLSKYPYFIHYALGFRLALSE